jgi:hypothetical protein
MSVFPGCIRSTKAKPIFEAQGFAVPSRCQS